MKDDIITSILSLIIALIVVGSAAGVVYCLGFWPEQNDATAQGTVVRYFDVVGPVRSADELEEHLNAWIQYVSAECVTDVDYVVSGRYGDYYSALVERRC